jgi:uncharacterized protein (TIGR00369 family)
MLKKAVGHTTSALPLRKNYCFACGPDNPDGMHLKFTHDKKRNVIVCRFRVDERFVGPPGHCHGGIIATILDDAMGKLNRLREVVAVTAQMTVDYIKPVPLNKLLRVESHEILVDGRRHIHAAEIMNQKREVLARSRGVFIAIDAQRFARYVEK